MVIEQWAVIDEPAPSDGTMAAVDLGGTIVAIGRLEGRLVAFDDTCSHRMCPLSEGVLAEGTITCPCHKSRFDLQDGQPITGPAVDPIRIRQVREDAGRIYVER